KIGSILGENKLIGDIPINFSSSPLLVIFIKTIKPQIYEEKNEFCAQKNKTLDNKTETVSSSTYLTENKKISIQNTSLDQEDLIYIERYKSSVRFTPREKMALVFGHLYQSDLFSDEELIQYNADEDFETNQNRKLLYDLQQVYFAYNHNPFVINSVFDDFTHFFPDIIKRLKA
ncbi:hypothetical protein HZS_3226, partial [Henneguya salminicola]